MGSKVCLLQGLVGWGIVGLLVMPIAVAGRSNDRLPAQPKLPFSSLPTSHFPLPTPPPHLARKFTCPTTLEPLTTALLRDLPGYINRSNVRLGSQRASEPTYAIVASQPDFIPLPTGSSEYPSSNDANLHQVFFTVLERQYLGKRVVEFQQYHWLFLAQTAEGWRLALLFSRIGSYPRDRQPVTPPRDSSQSATAGAIRTWLSSCESGAVKP